MLDTKNKIILTSTPQGDRNDFYEYYKKYYNHEPYPFQKQIFEHIENFGSNNQPMFMMGRRVGKSLTRKLYLDLLEKSLEYKKEISFKEFYKRSKLKGKYKKWK